MPNQINRRKFLGAAAMLGVLADFIETRWQPWVSINASQTASVAVCGWANWNPGLRS